jgi:hypothetical protein
MLKSICAVAALLAFTVLACAQSTSYQRGNDDGYNDIFPPSGTPSTNTDYGKGFSDGQDDADDEDHRMLRGHDPWDTSHDADRNE